MPEKIWKPGDQHIPPYKWEGDPLAKWQGARLIILKPVLTTSDAFHLAAFISDSLIDEYKYRAHHEAVVISSVKRELIKYREELNNETA